MPRLSAEEQRLVDSYDSGEWKPIKSKASEIQRYQDIAQATFRKDRRVSIRISSKDLKDIRKKALEEGMPYQTLMSSVLHKYVSGTLVQKQA